MQSGSSFRKDRSRHSKTRTGGFVKTGERNRRTFASESAWFRLIDSAAFQWRAKCPDVATTSTLTFPSSTSLWSLCRTSMQSFLVDLAGSQQKLPDFTQTPASKMPLRISSNVGTGTSLRKSAGRAASHLPSWLPRRCSAGLRLGLCNSSRSSSHRASDLLRDPHEETSGHLGASRNI